MRAFEPHVTPPPCRCAIRKASTLNHVWSSRCRCLWASSAAKKLPNSNSANFYQLANCKNGSPSSAPGSGTAVVQPRRSACHCAGAVAHLSNYLAARSRGRCGRTHPRRADGGGMLGGTPTTAGTSCRSAPIPPRAPNCRLRLDALEMALWLTPQGTARPEEVLTVLGVNDLLDAGAVLERARLELTDEIPSPSRIEGIA